MKKLKRFLAKTLAISIISLPAAAFICAKYLERVKFLSLFASTQGVSMTLGLWIGLTAAVYLFISFVVAPVLKRLCYCGKSQDITNKHSQSANSVTASPSTTFTSHASEKSVIGPSIESLDDRSVALSC